MELATQDDRLFVIRSQGDAALGYKMCKDLGVTHLRFNVFASQVAVYGWERLDRAVDEARDHGIFSQLTICGRPRWDADAGKPDLGIPHIDPDPDAFGKFVTDTVTHFKGRVNRFSMWNEPNYPAFLQSTKGDSARLYGALYDRGFRAARLVDPQCAVLWGEIAGAQGSGQWVRRALARGGYKASGFAVHPYQYQIAPNEKKKGDFLQFGHLAELKDYLARTTRIKTMLRKPLPIYITEFGWFCEGEKRGIPEATRAQWAKDSLRLAKRLGVNQFLYYTLCESPDEAWNTGIAGLDGTPSSTYNAIKAAYASLK